MKPHGFRSTHLAAALGVVVSIGMGQALGSGFALQEQNGSGLGNAYAGGAAVAEDASTIYFNPAGMSRMPGVQGAIAGNLICTSAKFNNSGSLPAALQPLGGTGGDAGSCNFPPAGYFAIPINNQWAVGVGVSVPFGLKTEYDSDWLGRFQAVKSELQVINVNPALSWKVSDMVTVGGGASWARVNKANLTSQVNYAGSIAQAAQTLAAGGLIPPSSVAPIVGAYTGSETFADVSGNDSSWGWNIGLLIEPDKQTRIGVAYRSAIRFNIGGSVNFTNPAVPTLPTPLVPVANTLANIVNTTICTGTPPTVPLPTPPTNGSCSQNISLSLKVPETANISFFRQIDSMWDVMADLQYTGWNTFQNLTIVRSTGQNLQSVPENFRNTWRGAIGANYHYSSEWMFRGGIAYDQTPVNSTDRTPRLPDSNRTWFSVGAQYKFNPQAWLDFAYTFIYMSNPSINQNLGSTAQYGLINGNYHNNVNIGGIQFTYTFK
jgi:long-chain fatty acid transport protein